jgi:predicted metalloprotease with PDZ domain
MAKVERPVALQINADVWRVEWLGEAEWTAQHLDDAADGLTYGRETTIYIRMATSNAMEQHYQGILIHEILHACAATTYSANNTILEHLPAEKHEEYWVGALSPPLLYVLRANPHVLKYLISDGTVQR